MKITLGGWTCLFLMFFAMFILKLLGIVTFSWWWVTAPLWGPVALVAGFFVLGLAIIVIALIIMLSVWLVIGTIAYIGDRNSERKLKKDIPPQYTYPKQRSFRDAMGKENSH